ncbi:hypothetical protein AVEN_159355-1 [Araneus ventricosus]|uniref:Uncharacterized protein n=1 Tax=Araneus ventricosus TaxID=182803 RepID=A0A4Y2A0X7_ARAVE|nr:hypothetical protein AVEN_159355-1 [Araneus ventricosus]
MSQELMKKQKYSSLLLIKLSENSYVLLPQEKFSRRPRKKLPTVHLTGTPTLLIKKREEDEVEDRIKQRHLLKVLQKEETTLVCKKLGPSRKIRETCN